MKTLVKIVACAGTLAALGILPASAHHSTAAFDTGRVLKITGTVTQFRWINPHASFKVDGGAGNSDTSGVWTVEMTAPNVLINQGWTRDALKVGDKVTIYVNPLRNQVELNDGSRGSLYVGVVLADGKTLGRTDGQGSGSSN
ncbi:MAG TPA: DUF6152 family protein [Gammaproteobacteria bacterium]|nr:DUF6152 family protein [Gammaproteobacteria bacterium]